MKKKEIKEETAQDQFNNGISATHACPIASCVQSMPFIIVTRSYRFQNVENMWYTFLFLSSENNNIRNVLSLFQQSIFKWLCISLSSCSTITFNIKWTHHPSLNMRHSNNNAKTILRASLLVLSLICLYVKLF